ncbi:hypothetical protein ACLB2K_073005 [Fragaria x ananassa]
MQCQTQVSNFAERVNHYVAGENIRHNPTGEHLRVKKGYLRSQTRDIEMMKKPIPKRKTRKEAMTSHREKGVGSIGESAAGQVEVYEGAKE